MKKLFTTLCCLFILQFTFAQKIVGYIDARLTDADANAKKLQWNKLTDIIYGFIQPSGSNGDLEVLSGAPLTVFNTVKTLANQNNVKFHFSSGGANYTVKQQLASISANPTARANFAKNVANILETNGMHGFDLDWEFPSIGTEVSNHVLLLKALREEFDKRGKGWTLAIAVGGETPSTGSQGVYHTDYVSKDAFQYIDYLNLMSYDIGASLGGNNHSSLKNALDNINDYKKMGCPTSKMILGVPFYGRDLSRWNWKKYSDIASGTNAATAYGADESGGQYYNGKKTLQDKVDLIMAQGGIGIMIWEITYDRLGNDPYSLLGAIYEKMAPYQCDAPQPNLGAAVSICGSTSVTLNTNITNTTGLTFSWKDATGKVVGSAKSYNATKAGKYTVDVSNGKCTNTGSIEVLGTLPTIDLGPKIDLCDPATATLDSKISGNGITFSWQKDNQTIDGATSSTLLVDRAGTYKVTASATGCTSSSASVIVTSQLINVEHQTLACKGNVTFTVTDAGSYEWYDAAENGTKLATGSSFTKNVTATTTFYVQKLATARVQATGCDGLDEWVAQVYQGGAKISYKGQIYTAKWYAESFNVPGGGDPWALVGPCKGITCKRTPVTVTVQNGGVCTGTFENSSNNTITVVPNPVENQAIISFALENSSNATIEVINVQGQVVKQVTINSLTAGNQSIEINTSDLANGIYICRISTDTKILTTKFSK